MPLNSRETTLSLLWITGIFSLALLGPTQGVTANRAPDPSGHTIRVASDSSLFKAAVQWIKEGGFITTQEVKRVPLRVDPRPLRPDFASLNLDKRHFADVDSSVLRRRTAVLQRLDVPQRNALAYSTECLFACDPRMIKEDEADRVECPKKQCEVIVVALSFPINTETNLVTTSQSRRRSESSD